MKRLLRHGRLVLAGLLLFFTAMLQANENSAPKTWRVVVMRDVYSDYQHFLAKRDPLSLAHFSGPHSRRDVVELVLLQQALQRGGAQRELRFVLTDSEDRSLKTLASGEADIIGASTWKSSLGSYAPKLLVSRPLIAEGHFMAGLYFPQGHPALATLPRQPQDIHRYTAICAGNWSPDLITLGRLGSPVLKTENWESMLGMLKKRRGDFLLAPFQPTPDLRLETDGLVLLPVPGLKVSLAGSRHFMLARQGPEAALLQAAVDRGITSLEQDGTLQRAYRESGFDDARTSHWRLLGH